MRIQGDPVDLTLVTNDKTLAESAAEDFGFEQTQEVSGELLVANHVRSAQLGRPLHSLLGHFGGVLARSQNWADIQHAAVAFLSDHRSFLGGETAFRVAVAYTDDEAILCPVAVLDHLAALRPKFKRANIRVAPTTFAIVHATPDGPFVSVRGGPDTPTRQLRIVGVMTPRGAPGLAVVLANRARRIDHAHLQVAGRLADSVSHLRTQMNKATVGDAVIAAFAP